MQTQTPSVSSTCHVLGHTLNTHVQYGTPTSLKDITLLENVQKFASKICCKSWVMDYESMLSYLGIPSLQQRRLQLKANMMCTVAVLSLKVYYFHIPPPTTICVPFPISLYHMPEQTLTIIPFSLTCSAFGTVYKHLLYVHQVVLYYFKNVILSYV